MSLQIWLIAVGVIVALAALINLFRNGNRKDNSRHQSKPADKAQHARHGTSHQAETAANLDDADHHITDHTLRRHAEAARMRGATAAHSVGDGNRLGPTATPSAAPSEGTHVRAEKTGLGSDTRAHTHTGSTSTVSTSTRQASGEARAHARSNDDRRGSIFGGTGALFPLLAAVAAGLASCQLGSAEGIRGIPATIGNLFGPAGSKVPVATIEATLPNAADVKAKAAEAVAVAKEKVAEVAEKAIEAATPVKVEPAKKESVKEAVAAAPTEELVVKGETHYYGSSPGASVAAWSAEAVLNPDYDTGTDDPVADTEPEQVAEAAPIAAEAAREPAKTASGATAYYGVSETPDVEHDWAAEAEMNPDYEATPAESEVAVEVRELYKTEPGVTAVFGGESWQAPENYYAPAVAPVVVAEAPREPYKTEPGVTANFGGETWQAPENYYAPAEAPVVVAEAPREPYKTEVGTTANFGGSTWQAPANYYAPVAPPCSDALASALKDGKINFETSSWEIDSDSFPTLDKIVKAAKTCGSASIEVGGHTDSTGKPPSNQTLSEMRAKAVMNYLVDHGVPAAKIKSVGFGQDKPIADNGTREGKAQNRRIEFVVTPG